MTGESRDHELPAGDLSPRDAYRLMTDLVAPRPIAWVSTLDEDGRGNLAPFSYYQAICAHPPTVVLGLGWNGDGSPKDTLRNALARRELTISHVTRPVAEVMNATSAAYGPEVSEWEALEVESVPARVVGPPRVAGALASLECRVVHAVPLGHGPGGSPSSTAVFAEVVHFHVREDLIERDERGHLRPMDPARLASVGRLGGIAYTGPDGVFELPRPPRPPRSSESSE